MAQIDLTPLQARVLELLLSGCQNKEISIKLGISYGWTKANVRRLYEKYGITNPGPKRLALINKFGRYRVIWEPTWEPTQETK